jgi:hypothetical protein
MTDYLIDPKMVTKSTRKGKENSLIVLTDVKRKFDEQIKTLIIVLSPGNNNKTITLVDSAHWYSDFEVKERFSYKYLVYVKDNALRTVSTSGICGTGGNSSKSIDNILTKEDIVNIFAKTTINR